MSAIHRRSFPFLKADYTVEAHIEALVDEGDVASSFDPGHCSRQKAPYTAKYISLHLSYRRPGVLLKIDDCAAVASRRPHKPDHSGTAAARFCPTPAA